MIPEDEGTAHLQSLVLPTLDCFERANTIAKAERDAADPERDACLAPMLASKDGNTFWVYFASYLHTAYATVPGVEMVTDNHPLSSAWDVGPLRVHLKSDVHALDFHQLSFDMDVASVVRAEVVLTWGNDGPTRVNPQFVHMSADKKIVWARSVHSLLVPALDTLAVAPPRRGVKVASTRVAPAREKTDGTAQA